MSKWKDMPAEVKEGIVQRCTEKTRIALMSTSSSNRQTVEGTRLKSIKHLKIIQETDGSFEICVCYRGTLYSLSHCQFSHFMTCSTVEKLKKTLIRILKPIKCIKRLEIRNVSCDIPLEQWSKDGYQQRMMVEILTIIAAEGADPKNIINQIEPVHLRTVQIQNDGGSSSIYDMPQIVLAEEVHAGKSIREGQLLNLNARHVKIEHSLPYSLHKFVEKCTSSADTKLLYFKFSGSNVRELKNLYSPESDKVMLETSNPQLKFELTFDMENEIYGADYAKVEGSIRYESERIASEFLYRNDQSVLRYIKELEIYQYSDRRCWRVAVTRKNHARYQYSSLKSPGEVQQKFDEIMEHFDCIENLKIRLGESEQSESNMSFDRKLRWTPRAKKLLVQQLEVHGDHSTTSIHDLLNQIEPAYLMNIRIESEEKEDTIFDMPHIYAASNVFIKGSAIKPEHLLRLNADLLFTFDAERSDTELLTAAAINQYIKKRLINLNEKYCVFQLQCLNPTVREEEVLEGLPIVRNELNGEERKIIVDTGHGMFVLEILYTRRNLFGIRSRRGNLSFF